MTIWLPLAGGRDTPVFRNSALKVFLRQNVILEKNKIHLLLAYQAIFRTENLNFDV